MFFLWGVSSGGNCAPSLGITLAEMITDRSIRERFWKRAFSWIQPWLVAAAHLYCVAMAGWAVSSWLFGDRWWWLFLLNSFVVFLFLPLPLLFLLAWMTRRRELWLGLGLVLTLGIFFCGRLLPLPRLGSPPPGHDLTVMTFNGLGSNQGVEQFVMTLRKADVDLIVLQELNPTMADAIQRDLATDYPFQILEPQVGVTGMGVVGRYPMHSIDLDLAGQWVGAPQVIEMMFDGATVTLVNFHAIPPGFRPEQLERGAREREAQARVLASLVDRLTGPMLVLGDLNASEYSRAYRLMTAAFHDAWRSAGGALGHTFPGGSRPMVGGISVVPRWLVRLDYVFCSDHWEATGAWIGPWDGVSDHRPVAAALVLRE